MPYEFDHSPFCGWINYPEGVQFQLTQMPYPRFADAAPNLMQADNSNKDILLYKAWKDVLGNYPDYVAQVIGDCTSQASGHLVDLTQCIQIALGHTKEEYKETSTEAIYGAGREMAGMLNRWINTDGCYGAAMARAVTEIGVVPREIAGPYSGQRAKQWGNTGIPANIRAEANKHKIKTTSIVTTLEELDAALANAYAVIVCSNQGFTMQRDQDGFCYARGSWAHAMMIAAKRVTGKPGYLICQSWGPNVPSGTQVLDQPNFSFWVDPRTIAYMLSQQDSFVFSQFDGYPGRGLPSNWTYEGFA